MKFVRFGPVDEERPGVWLDRGGPEGAPGILDIRAMAFDLNEIDARFLATGGPERAAALLREPRPVILPAAGLRLGPPVRPGKILCLGKNYAEHAKEFGGGIPETPVIFSKALTSLQGPNDPIVLPRQSTVVDGEAELAVVIGRRARRLSETNAMDFVAGYTVLNDVTDREAQRAGGQWFYGKSFDGFCPLGPWLVTADEVRDPHALRVFSRLNGESLQDGTTADMIVRIPRLLAFITAGITLEPGDVIATGTPSGIGSARNPPRPLREGDLLETGVEGLGVQRATAQREA
ncbi:MAG: fumarylacetoacetate hydrolase family protein [Kiritimatiellia bacterium]|nr:fumarylacetoacetate hydrolase family protein [Kiritimatiellia bacterium]